MFSRRIKIPAIWKNASIPLLLFLCGFILSVTEKAEKIDPYCKAVLVSGPRTEKDSKDVNPNSSTPNCTAVWLLAADLGHSSVKQTNPKCDKTNGLAGCGRSKQDFDFNNSENTLGQVHSHLGRRFTLLGEKPSGTS